MRREQRHLGSTLLVAPQCPCGAGTGGHLPAMTLTLTNQSGDVCAANKVNVEGTFGLERHLLGWVCFALCMEQAHARAPQLGVL